MPHIPSLLMSSAARLLPAAGLTVLLISPSCSLPAEVEALAMRPDFTTPESAGRSFLAAISTNLGQSEYLCLSEALKEEHGATLDGWLLFREEIREEAGSLLDHAYRLEPVGRDSMEDGLLLWWGRSGDPTLGLWMTEQHYFDLYGRNGRKLGAFLDLPPGEWVELDGSRLRVEVQDSALRAAHDMDVQRFVLGSEWKIRGLIFPESGPVPWVTLPQEKSESTSNEAAPRPSTAARTPPPPSPTSPPTSLP